jgi:hypothetical protein
MTRAACGFAIALLTLGAAPAPLVEIRNAGDPARRVETRAELDTGDIRLSGEVRLTLAVEGPAPLGVTPPKPFLTKSNVWRVREDGLPIREVLPNGREKWSQVYRLSPLVPGEPKVALGPLTIRPGGEQDLTIEWKTELVVRVATSIENPTPEALRPPTDIEHLPPTPPVERGSSPWLFAIVPILLVVAAAALFFAKRRRPPAAPRDAAWAERELAAAGLTADRCAVVLRQYLSYRFGVRAETRTTPELSTALRADGRLPGAVVAEWQAFLDECDAARFSGTAAAVAGLADRARALVAGAEEQVRMSQEKAQREARS